MPSPSTNVTYTDDDTASDDSVENLVAQLNSRRRTVFPNKRTIERRKPRRWPLVLRFIKGAIHADIALPVFLHALLTAVLVYLDVSSKVRVGLPAQIVPSLSIVVGLMLVFRNQTSYQRFWDGRNNLTVVLTSVRNLTRSFLSCLHTQNVPPSPTECSDIERTVRILIALPTTITNALRAEWHAPWAPLTPSDINKVSGAITPRLNPEYSDLLPLGLKPHESEGLALPLELTFLIEAFIKRGHDRGWFHAPQASQLTVQLNTLVDAYGRMETIRNTPYPVAIMIHQRQVLALFGAVLPFAIVEDSQWWSVPIVSLVMFTLYGIEAIASHLEDPFGYERNDIKMNDIVEDARTELGVMLDEWRRCSRTGLVVGREMFLDEM